MGVVIVSQWRRSMRDIVSCTQAHAQLNVSAVTARVHARPKLACTRKISSKTVILSSIDAGHIRAYLHGMQPRISQGAFHVDLTPETFIRILLLHHDRAN